MNNNIYSIVVVLFLDTLIISHLPYGPTATFTIYNTVMRHDIPNVGTMSEAYPHLIFHNLKTKLGERVRPIYLLYFNSYSTFTFNSTFVREINNCLALDIRYISYR